MMGELILQTNNTTAAESVSSNGHWRDLFPSHAAEFNASGISAETVAAAGIRSLSDRREIAAMLNRKTWPQRNGSAWAIPYFDASGAIVHWRVKPERPPQTNGKTVAKYLSPSGSCVRVYFPPGVHQRIADGATEIIITEGEKKALSATQAGFCCIGLSGVDCWHARKSTTLLPDLEFSWTGRTAFIAFDSDAADNAAHPGARVVTCGTTKASRRYRQNSAAAGWTERRKGRTRRLHCHQWFGRASPANGHCGRCRRIATGDTKGSGVRR